MPEVTIRNLTVSFPFEPYDVQKAYMEKVIDCLQTRAHGMLESPTGTGKTLSLLCSSLAWLTAKKAHSQAQYMKKGETSEFGEELENDLSLAVGSVPGMGENLWNKTKIIYASRTHSQLTQAIAELKRTSYAFVRMAVIGSRDQLCINEEVCNEPESSIKLAMCQTLVKGRQCSYHSQVERKKDHPDFTEAGIMDVEDLVKICSRKHVCPYFMAKELKQAADIIFMPYNYILDPRTRKQQDIDLKNSVVILDEGHNVEKICEDSASFSISSTDVAICMSEVTAAMKYFSEGLTTQDFNSERNEKQDFTDDELMSLKSMFIALEAAIDSIQLTENNKTEASFPGEYIFSLLEKASISNETYCKLYITIDSVIQYLSTVSANSNSPFQHNGAALDRFLHFMGIVFSFENKSFTEHFKDVQECYKVFVTNEKPRNMKRKQDSWLQPVESESKPGGKVVNFWCFNPGFGMKNLLKLGIHSIIVTSGTLSPLPPLISELGIPINVTLENGHVINKNQVFVSVVSQGPDGVALNSTYKNRGNESYISSLGRTICNFSRIIPEGLLVFFPSYTVLNTCKDHWQTTGIWSQISASKEIFVEPQGKREFNEVMSGYYARIAAPGSKGACFLAVCRGKVSEGLDFADHNGRAVILTGLPFPPFFDPRVVMKRHYLDRNRKKVSGNSWYQLEATRAVNQAVGRVIRHRNDYGAVIFCDGRFGDLNIQKQFSAWLRPYVLNCSQFGMVTRGLCQFFKHAKEMLPQSVSSRMLPSAWSDRASESVSQPVSATFDTSKPRWLTNVKQSRSQPGNFNWHTPQTVVSPLSSTYSRISPSIENKKPTSMFGALECSAKVIDFNQVDIPTENTSAACGNINNEEYEADLDPDVFKPHNKRRKIRVMGVTLGYENNVQEQSSGNVSSKIDRTERNKSYLSQVRQSLSDSENELFREAVSLYSAKSNYHQLIQNLESVFKRPDQQSLLIGFESYIKGPHKSSFAAYCKKVLSEK